MSLLPLLTMSWAGLSISAWRKLASCNSTNGLESVLGDTSGLLDQTYQRDTVFCLRCEESAMSECFKQSCFYNENLWLLLLVKH